MRILALLTPRRLAARETFAVLAVRASKPDEGMMNDGIRVIRRPRLARPLAARTAVAIIAGGIALPPTAFGGSPSLTVAGGSSTTRRLAYSRSSNAQQALAFARCMRSHGVRNWPDPNSSGVFPKLTPRQLGVSGAQLQAAQTACSNLLPNGAIPPGGQPTQAELRAMESDALKFVRCMRSHGVPNWPDYTLRNGIPIFDLHGSSIAPNSPQISARQLRCKSHLYLSAVPPTSGGAA